MDKHNHIHTHTPNHTHKATTDKNVVAFPTLTAEQIALIAPAAEEIAYPEGTILINEGDADFCFYIVTQGSIRILEHSTGEAREIAVHGSGEFTGDVDMLTGHRSLFQAVAGADCRALELGAAALREVIRAHSSLGDLLLNAFLVRRDLLLESGFTGVRVIGSRWSQDTFRIRDFLARNHVPFTWLDLDREAGVEDLLAHVGVTPEETPIILYGNHKPLKNPSNQTLAEAVGFSVRPDDEIYDLVVVGGGPAGLAAAVYGASEGLKTLVIEENGPGGQASWSSKIENYLGFPTGLSGSELAERAVLQAEKFGVQLITPCCARSLQMDGPLKLVTLEDGQTVRTRTVVIATGAAYQRLSLEHQQQYEGASIFYSATAVEATMCQDSNVAIVGGGNSAGQAAIFLSQYAHQVYIFIRGATLNTSMSRYLIRRIEEAENIELVPHTHVTGLHGADCLRQITVEHTKTKAEATYDVTNLFVFIGAKPHTEWLDGALELDDKSFIKTGHTLAGFPQNDTSRAPFHLETSMPGVFAAGDVRAGSVKRVASAVGEGSMAVQFVHQVLADQ